MVLTVGEQAELPLALSVGSDTTVTVNTGAEILETDRSSQSTVVNQVQITNLPTNGRNYVNFTLTNSQIARDSTPSVGCDSHLGAELRRRERALELDQRRWRGLGRLHVGGHACDGFAGRGAGVPNHYERLFGRVWPRLGRRGEYCHQIRYKCDACLGVRVPAQSVYPGDETPFSNVYQPAYTRVQAGFTVGGAIKKDRTFYFFGTEITRREESGFTNIGAGNFGLANTDVSRFFGAPTGALVILATPQQQAFFNATPSGGGGFAGFPVLPGRGGFEFVDCADGQEPGVSAGYVRTYGICKLGAAYACVVCGVEYACG